MGIWKVSVTMRIAPELRDELVKFATQERRSLGNLGGILLEWSLEQLLSAGSTNRLLKHKILLPTPHTCAHQVGNPLEYEQNAGPQRRRRKNG